MAALSAIPMAGGPLSSYLPSELFETIGSALRLEGFGDVTPMSSTARTPTRRIVATQSATVFGGTPAVAAGRCHSTGPGRRLAEGVDPESSRALMVRARKLTSRRVGGRTARARSASWRATPPGRHGGAPPSRPPARRCGWHVPSCIASRTCSVLRTHVRPWRRVQPRSRLRKTPPAVRVGRRSIRLVMGRVGHRRTGATGMTVPAERRSPRQPHVLCTRREMVTGTTDRPRVETLLHTISTKSAWVLHPKTKRWRHDDPAFTSPHR